MAKSSKPPEMTFQQHIADYLVREHHYPAGPHHLQPERILQLSGEREALDGKAPQRRVMNESTHQASEVLLYQTADGHTRVEVRFDGETTWLSLGQLADLFQRDKSVISRHIKHVFDEGELRREATVAEYATVHREGDREVTRDVEHFNLDVIISVGYRVKSHRGTQFRVWANRIVNAYLEFAELQALGLKPMTMADWIAKLDDFLALSDREILTHAGSITHDEAVVRAELEYERFARVRAALPSPVEADFDEAVTSVKQLEAKRPRRPKGSQKP